MSSNLKRIILAVFAVTVVLLLIFSDLQTKLEHFLTYVEVQGSFGVIVFILIYIAATILFIPGSALTLGAGAIYGIVYGTIIVSIASVIGATLAFLIGRYLAREIIAKKIESNKRFEKIDSAVAKEGWKIVFLTRLSPIFPFNLLNYSFGLTKVKLKDYFFASWIGMIPGTILYVYLGTVTGELARVGSPDREKTTAEWALLIVGLIATILVTAYVTKIAKNSLNVKVEENVS